MKTKLSYIFLICIVPLFACKKESSNKPCTETTWYFDSDSDGKGDKTKPFKACTQPAGYVDNNTDDDDTGALLAIPTKGYDAPTSYDGYKLLWADEFDGTSLNENNWNYEIGNGSGGWGNNELQYYKKENTSVKDGRLIIKALKEDSNGFAYSSSRLTTQNKFNFKYGRVDVRAVLPKGQGIWPAFWMLGKSINTLGWPKCGEIDIMEMVGGNEISGTSGSDRTTYGTAHWDNNGAAANYGGNTKLASGAFRDEFHVFSITWNAKEIIWYLDNKQFHKIDITPEGLSELQGEFFLLINLAVGGNWPGKPDATTVFPQQLVVDYIRVYQ